MALMLPFLNPIPHQLEPLTAFNGYNHNLRIREDEFFDTQNMTTKFLPVVSVRQPRAKLRTLRKPHGLFAHEKMCWVDGDSFYYDGVEKGKVTEGAKQFVRMGAFVIIWPDKKYYNTHRDEFGSLENKTVTGNITAHLCRIDGEPYNDYAVAPIAPENPQNGALWLDTSVTPNILKTWAEASRKWAEIVTVYTKIVGEGIGKGFKKHDGITVSGITAEPSLNQDCYIVDCTDDSIIVVGLIQHAFSQTEPVTIERTIPDMDFICEYSNRLYGCSSETHEIMVSAAGDPKNFNEYLLLDSDSYRATVGSGGDFTGCCAHQNSVLFFKENIIHRMTGNRPSDYRITTTTCQGVKRDCHKSLVTMDETLYFKSVHNVCKLMYELPEEIGYPLGQIDYKKACAGAVNNQYFIAMEDEYGKHHIFVYDTQRGVWIREDDANVIDFANLDGHLYMLLTDGTIWSLTGGNGVPKDDTAEDEKIIDWMLETGEMGVSLPCNQYISRIQLHIDCDIDTQFTVSVQYDNNPPWQDVYFTNPTHRKSMVIPLIPQRCHIMQLRITGKGYFRLYSIIKHIESGSDVYAR